MKVYKFPTKQGTGISAAEKGANFIKQAINEKGSVNVILATGASQFEMLNHLTSINGIEWRKVTCFHLDEYIALPESHGASFRKYLSERFLEKVGSVKAFNFVNGSAANTAEECNRLEQLIKASPIDVAFVGIGENGHLAFNDPPADFETEKAYIIAALDMDCRKQQMGEGWFKTIEEVPKQAISMSIRQILKSRHIIVTVPDKRKAEAVKNTIKCEVSNMHPSSILQTHPSCYIYLDNESGSLI
ncbi:MAG TPA: glucosamine-6-phosphate deaminase [Lentisphaeria bacterium]|nr:MAG: glucosamine-6-phosphate deaminase [Lentisphaerae bacterium GWF2_38_69]HBM15363.1 glucosamine-6-phosphate deaminase [Lentisphaeria bacterium]